MIDHSAERRVAALREYEIMDTPPETSFDDLTLLTSFICGTPMALVTLLDWERQWFKSKVGLEREQTPIEHAFCAHAIKQESIFLVPDATKDSRFQHNPFVTGDPHIRFYAGAPLITPEGVPLGTLCAIDRQPREFSPEQQAALSALARQVMQAMELRKTVAQLRAAIEAKEQSQKQVAQLEELLPMCAWCRKVRDDDSFWHHVEEYLAARTGVSVSHGICPDCAKQFTAELDEKKAEKERQLSA